MGRFKGGIHPKDHKNADIKNIKKVFLPEKVVIPLGQHIGKLAKPIVKVGDHVKTGQCIAKADGFISANVHASLSGTVKSIAPFLHPVFGKKIDAITIESDGKDEKYENTYQLRNYNMFSAVEIRNLIADAGIVGLGGATFPTHVKVSPPEGKIIEEVILNGAECEPYLRSDHSLMLKRSKDILDGLKIIMLAVSAKKGVIALEDNKPDCLHVMKEITVAEKRIEVRRLKTRYPQGGEKQLIKAVLNKEVPSGGLPMDVGVLVQNVGTALAIYEAVVLGKPLYERVVTISGGASREPGNWKLRIGTLVSDFVKEAGCYSQSPVKVVMGGPMMGMAMSSLEVPIIKGTSGVLLLSKKEVETEKERVCIRCGRCVSVCPIGLSPYLLSLLAEREKFEMSKENNVLDCMECGCCAYICPAKKPLVHTIKFAKLNLKK